MSTQRSILFVLALAITPAAQAAYSSGGSFAYTKDDGKWEFFADAVEDYGAAGDLYLTIDGVNALLTSMKSIGYSNWIFANESNAWSNDYQEANWDDSYNDAADMSYFSGHGGSGGFLLYGAGGDNWVSASETTWGEMDLEVIALDACQSLDSAGRTAWGNANLNDGVHAIHGFQTNSHDITTTASQYGTYLKARYSTYAAWVAATKAGHSSSYTGASVIFSNGTCNGLNTTAYGAGCDPTSGSSWSGLSWAL